MITEKQPSPYAFRTLPATAQCNQTTPDAPPLTGRAADQVASLYELNRSLGRLRERLFGEGETVPDEVPGPKGPALEVSIGGMEYQTRNAHAQVSSILERL